MTYPQNNSISEGAFIIKIDWEKHSESDGRILGIIIDLTEQILRWVKGGMLTCLYIMHISFGNQFLHAEVTTRQVIIHEIIVNTIGSCFDTQNTFSPVLF